jgi:hypothetical protein
MFNTCVLPYELSIAFSISTVFTGERKSPITAEQLADKWGISLDIAQATLKATIQPAIRMVAHPSLSRRLRTNNRQLRYQRIP